MVISLASIRTKLDNKVFLSPPAELITHYWLTSSSTADTNYPSDISGTFASSESIYGVPYNFKTMGLDNKKPYSDYPEAELALIVPYDITTVVKNDKFTVNSKDYIVLAVEDYRYGGGSAAQNVILGKLI